MFSCLRCGSCCKDLIVEFYGCHIGLFLMAQEVNLFPADMVSPCWAVGSRGRSRPRKDVKSYQLNVKDCPYISNDSCRIYQRRPTVCRAHPLNIHVNPTTMKITAASVDSKCPKCQQLHFGEGNPQVLGKCFPNDILLANVAMTQYLRWMFREPTDQAWLYDLEMKQWKQVTTEIIEMAR